jgi:peptide/nickel transport system substrate-binding protein
VKRTRFVGVLITVAILLAVALYYRENSDNASPAPTPTAARGGQIVGSIRSEIRSYNRFVESGQTADLIYTLTQGRLVRINRASFELEPWLAERWDSSDDGLRHTLRLREGVTWSDGTPFTSADVLFSLRAAFDPTVKSRVAASLTVGGKPIQAEAPDPMTVVFVYPAPSGPGLRLLDGLPILPKHKLEAALASGAFNDTWNAATPPPEIAGLGPFLVREYQPGQRVVLDRNPRYWRKAPDGQSLPYLDRIVLEVVPDQNAELLRLQSGALDITSAELRPEDYVAVRRAEQERKLRIVELGIGTDPDAFWFCLKPEVKARDPRFAFVQKREFRQAISHAVDREAFAETVFLGEATPLWGPITPGNSIWFSPDVPRYPHDLARARELLKSIGLEDRNGNGVIEDAAGTEARLTVLTQKGITYYERGTTVLREQAAKVGIALDIAPLDQGTVVKAIQSCDYDAVYFRPVMTDLDPAGNMDLWLSSGASHLWNMGQKKPATEWEAQIDALMAEQSSVTDVTRRRELFNQVQRIWAENVPALYFAAPRLFYAHSARLMGVVPSIQRPPVLWNADSLSVGDANTAATR